MEVKARGYILSGLALLSLAALLFALVVAHSSERALTNVKINQLRLRYAAESLIEIERHLIKNKLDNMENLSVTYIRAVNPFTGEVVTQPVESSTIFETGSEVLQGICEEAINIIKQATAHEPLGVKFTSFMSIEGGEEGEFTLSTLDKDLALLNITDDTEGELLPVEIKMEAAFSNIRLVTVTELSGIIFEAASRVEADEVGYGVLQLKLNTENIKMRYTKFQWLTVLEGGV